MKNSETLMKDKDVPQFLFPSSVIVSSTPSKVITILGSCVSVCLWNPILKVGGINHFMLPFWNGSGLASPKYGNIAIEKVIEKLVALNSHRPHLKAKIFGGAQLTKGTGYFNVGHRNIAMAQNMLHDLKIPIIGSSVGGKLGRKILFDTASGEVQMKYIQKKS